MRADSRSCPKYGGPGGNEVDPLGDLRRYITEFDFGDVYSRSGFTLREREFAAVAMLTAMGGREQQLRCGRSRTCLSSELAGTWSPPDQQ